MRIDTLVTDTTGKVGFSCMQNSPTLFNGSDSGYMIVVSGGNGLSTPTVEILKYLTGVPSVPGILASVAVPSLVLGDPFVFQADWVSDLGLLGGTLLKAYIGTSTTDFNDLNPVLSTIDTVFPLLIPTTEGIAQYTFSGVSPDFKVNFDDTSIFSLT